MTKAKRLSDLTDILHSKAGPETVKGVIDIDKLSNISIGEMYSNDLGYTHGYVVKFMIGDVDITSFKTVKYGYTSS